jgi:hypothetical protein
MGRQRAAKWRRRAQLIVGGATAAGGTVAVQGLYRALVRALIGRAIDRLGSGDIKPLLRLYAKNVRFVFPGSSSWAADLHHRREVEQWFRRFVQVGFEPEIHEVLVNGPIWRTSICIHFTDAVFDSEGRRIYRNEGVILGRSSWGKVRHQVFYEDTERGSELERWLAANRPQLVPAGPPSGSRPPAAVGANPERTVEVAIPFPEREAGDQRSANTPRIASVAPGRPKREGPPQRRRDERPSGAATSRT